MRGACDGLNYTLCDLCVRLRLVGKRQNSQAVLRVTFGPHSLFVCPRVYARARMTSDAGAFSLSAMLDATGDALTPAFREVAFAHLLLDPRAPRARRVCKAFEAAYAVGNARFQLIADRGFSIPLERRNATTFTILQIQRERTRILANSVQFNVVGKMPWIEEPTRHSGLILPSGTNHRFLGLLPKPL